MKRVILACAVLAIALTGCNRKTEVTKVADYLYEYEAVDAGLTEEVNRNDIANRSVWVTIRENYEKRYEFKL